MKALVTGAAGFIGSQIAYKLCKKGFEVVLVDNYSYGKKDNLLFDDMSLEEQVIEMDIRDREKLDMLFSEEKFDYVFNIAGIAPLPDCQVSPSEAIEVNSIGLINILECCKKYGIKNVIQASSNAVYENIKSFPTKEEDFETPTLIYPISKYFSEVLAKSYCNNYDMNVTCLRFANVYGPHIDCLRKQPPFIAYMIRELFYNRIPVFHSDGNQKRDYIYVDDLIELAFLVMDNKGFDVVNVSSGTSYSVNELYDIACKIMKKNIKAEFASDSNYWGKYTKLFEGEYPLKLEVVNNEINKYTLCDNSHAKSKFGWEPKVGIGEGLRIVIDKECSMLKNMRGDI